VSTLARAILDLVPAPQSEQVTGSTYDGCWNATEDLGQVVGAECTATQRNFISPATSDGFQIAEVTQGPNNGVFYVYSASVRLNLKAVRHVDLRSTGPAHPIPSDGSAAYEACDATYTTVPSSLNTYTVNTGCKPPGTQYGGLVNHTTAHEGTHMTLALDAAVDNGNDLRAEWEDEWSEDGSNLEDLLADDKKNAQEKEAVAWADPNHNTFQVNTTKYLVYWPDQGTWIAVEIIPAYTTN